MASAFWFLEDGRGFAKRWSGMAIMLELITDELKDMEEADEFYHFLERFVYREELGDFYNGYGGFIRGEEDIMFNFDLRSFTSENRAAFWKATQRAYDNLVLSSDKNNLRLIEMFNQLLEMHRRVISGEDPMLFNDIRIIEPEPEEKIGPGWQN